MADNILIPLDLFPLVKTEDKSDPLRKFITDLVQKVNTLINIIEELEERIIILEP